MVFYKNEDIRSFFDLLNDNVRYILTKNIAAELPNGLKIGKDIDIVVHPNDYDKYREMMPQHGYKLVVHPHGIYAGWKYLYNMKPACKHEHKDTLVQADAYDCLCTKSIMMNAWLPLDKKINDSIWIHRVWDDENKWWIMDDENMVIYLITRCVFEKNGFSAEYISEIKKRKRHLYSESAIKKLNMIFFRFSNELLKLVEADRYDLIIPKYKTFVDY